MSIVKRGLASAPQIAGLQAPVEDARYGGQYGWTTDIQEYLSQHPYTSGQIIPFVMRNPDGLRLLNDGGLLAQTFKSLLEVGSHRIEGLRRSIQPEVGEYEVGGSGTVFHYHSNAKEDQSEVTFTMYDRNNGCVSRAWEFFYRTFIMDAKTKTPMIVTMVNPPPSKILADFYSWVMIFIEPDITQTKAVDAYMIVNMSPKTMPTIEHRRDLSAAREIREISITMTGMQDTSFGTLAVAQLILNRVTLTGANPQMQPAPLEAIDADVATGPGYLDGVNKLSRAAISTT